jgi:hypothetical protein
MKYVHPSQEEQDRAMDQLSAVKLGRTMEQPDVNRTKARGPLAN